MSVYASRRALVGGDSNERQESSFRYFTCGRDFVGCGLYRLSLLCFVPVYRFAGRGRNGGSRGGDSAIG